MKILLTNHYLNGLRGSELWTYDMAKMFTKFGHKVLVASNEHGIISRYIKMFAELTDKPVETDFALVNHYTTLPFVTQSVKKIHTRHGYPELETPPMDKDGKELMNAYVAVTPEMWALTQKQQKIEPSIIFNGVDRERFYPKKPVNKKLTNVLYISNWGGVEDNIKKACGQLGLNYKRIGGADNAIWNVEDTINDADLIISMGRGVYQALACGRNVIAGDQNGMDYLLNTHNFEESQMFNCSGRNKKNEPTVEFLMEEMKKYEPKIGEAMMSLVDEYHDLEKNALNYLDIYFHL